MASDTEFDPVNSRLPALIHDEMIETQYQQARNNIFAENIVLIYMVATALLHTPWRIVAGWAALEVSTQIYRTFRMIRRYAAGLPAQNFAKYWARHHALYQTFIGLIWGGSAFLFAHGDSPESVALTLCGLVIITSGAVPGISYNLPALYGFVGISFALMAARLFQLGGLDYSILAAAGIFYAVVLMLMGRLQARTIAEGIQIRFENTQLLEDLTIKTDEAVAANLAKSQFLAAASHDLRQPLHALGLLAGSLHALSLRSDTRKIIDDMQANIGALEGLFNGLLDIARFDAGVVTVERVPLAADQLFDRLDYFLRPTAEELGLDLRFRSDGSVLFTDVTLIEQIMLNLGTNALRNTLKGGVLIGARRRGNAVRLEIWDSGTGIEAAHLERIFDEFVQLGNPERNRRKGMGLGLAIAKRSALLLGSDIAVSSRIGRGSFFSLTQPLALGGDSSRQIANDPEGVTGPIGRLSLLVLDDDPAVRSALATLFSQWGVSVSIVATIAQANAALGHTSFDLILADYRLPETATGLDFIIATQASLGDSAPPAYLVTGDMDATVLARAKASNVKLLHKPLGPARLLALLNSIAAQSVRIGTHLPH